MKTYLNLPILFITVVLFQPVLSQDRFTVLQKKGNATQLIVDGKPFIILGGEVGNSSASTMQYIQSIWPKLKSLNLNTVLLPVYWELIEKEEGKFDFSLIKQLIVEARNNNLKIVFLWFGSWKNSMSSHAPAWIKLNQDEFPRIKDDQNRSHEILTPFSDNNLQADLNTFKNLMNCLREFDGNQHTVIMIQVENEIGMLPTARDYCALANEAFYKDVPAELIEYLQLNKDRLATELLERWKSNGLKINGNWEDVFGKSPQTDEIFMAWYYSLYTNKIAEAGKKIYPIPTYVNAALIRPGKEPGSGYPSAGPLPHLKDIWKAAGSAIDFLAPDFYNPDFKHWNDLYTSHGDPLFIPEHRFDKTIAAKELFAIGHYAALGFSPFSVESVADAANDPLSKMNSLIAQLSTLISTNQGQGKIDAVLFDKQEQETSIHLGKYLCTFKHDYTLGWSPAAKEDEWPTTSALIIQTGEDQFYIAGSGVVVTFKPFNADALNVGILDAQEGSFENNEWIVLRHLNGDQTHQGRHIRIPVGDYSIQKFELYLYK